MLSPPSTVPSANECIAPVHTWRVLFHVHSRASRDSLMSPRTILRYCRDHAIDAVAICDHDALRGAATAQRLARHYGVSVIPAVEYSTNAGDIIGLFIDALPATRDIAAVLRFIRDRGGLSVLPHAMRGHDLARIPMDQVDLIESANARCSDAENDAAAQLATRFEKPTLAGADAHVAQELGMALNVFTTPESPIAGDPTWQRAALLTAHRRHLNGRSPVRFTATSRLIRGMRSMRPQMAMNALRVLAREHWHRATWRLRATEGER